MPAPGSWTAGAACTEAMVGDVCTPANLMTAGISRNATAISRALSCKGVVGVDKWSLIEGLSRSARREMRD